MAPPPVVVRKARKPAPTVTDSLRSPIVILIGVTAAVLLGVIIGLLPDSGSETFSGSANKELDAFFEKQGVNFNGAKVLCSGGECALVATRNLRNGEVALRWEPRSLIELQGISQTTIGQGVWKNNASILIGKADNHPNMGQAFFNVFTYSFYIAMSKKDRASALQPWLKSLPPASDLSGGLFWDTKFDACVDNAVASEARVLREMVPLAVESAEAICEDAPEACAAAGGRPPNEEEFRWAMGIYLTRNHQDQAIIPGLDFARYDNSRGGLSVNFNREQNVLEATVSEPYKKGERLTIPFGRGPATQLASMGFWDPNMKFIDARIRNPDPENKAATKLCAKSHELVFGVEKPREALLNCIAAIVAPPEDRKSNIVKLLRTSKLLQFYTYGNCTGVLSSAMKSFNGVAMEPYCHQVANPKQQSLVEDMQRYLKFAQQVTETNLEYCFSRHKKLGLELGLLTPEQLEEGTRPQPEPEDGDDSRLSAEEEQVMFGQNSAGAQSPESP